MKKTLLTLIILMAIGVLCSSSGICASEDTNLQTPGKKAGEGASNIALGWTELPLQIVNKTKESGPITGLFTGIFEGAYKAVARTTSGVAQLATFPVGGYDRPKAIPNIHSTK